MIRTKQIGSVKVTDPSGGKHAVLQFQDEVTTNTLSGPRTTLGLKSYRLENGNPVNYVSEIEFYDVFGERKLSVVA
ncbi:hypothetical protein SAMN05660489_03701 [Pseudomonas sp. LAMO17WK12:I10]|uniref:hypothetical protein n=1 Tax=unclassified Pseudomonas TaxID=196821 RepID=UPI000BCECA8A|nr:MULTISPECIES: hypothetical protein [unclassified Pseudomonas]PXX63819.1 hypothetical protein H160_03923 [Pseudomonas sp. LAMO17WK12:I9]SNY39937.1 hypothetical protein SAMN05660489_03701 [Pseudomonas sp. LAMO17WK12:I10]